MKTWQRRSLLALGAVGALAVAALGGVYGMSAAAVGGGHTTQPHAFDASRGDLATGQRLANLYGCTECHAPDLGGAVIVDDMPFARIAAPNLTAGATGGAMTDEEFEQAVRHGIGRDGRKLLIMPSEEYTYLSDHDVASILAYLRTVPPVERSLPARRIGPVGRALTVLGKVQFQSDIIAADPEARHLVRPGAEETMELGHYLTRLCIGCHRADLNGGPSLEPGGVPVPSLLPNGRLGGWTYDQFRTALMTGRRPDGTELSDQMPWRVFGQAEEHELTAMWAYLTSLEAKPE